MACKQDGESPGSSNRRRRALTEHAGEARQTAVVEAYPTTCFSPTFVRAALKSTRERLVTAHASEIKRAQTGSPRARSKGQYKYLDMAAIWRTLPVYRKIDELEREQAPCRQRIVSGRRRRGSAGACERH